MTTKRKATKAPADRKPFTIPVGSLRFKVEFVDVVPDADGDGPLHGLYDPDTETIYVLKSLSPERQRWVLWHEIFHAVLDENGFEKLSADEKLVDMLAHNVIQIRKAARWL